MHATIDHFAADQCYLTLRQRACSHRNVGKRYRTRRKKNTQDTRKPPGITWTLSRAWLSQIVSTESLAAFPFSKSMAAKTSTAHSIIRTMSCNHISSCQDWLAFAAFQAGGDAEDMRYHSHDHRSHGNGAAPPMARDNKQSGHEHYNDMHTTASRHRSHHADDSRMLHDSLERPASSKRQHSRRESDSDHHDSRKHSTSRHASRE